MNATTWKALIFSALLAGCSATTAVEQNLEEDKLEEDPVSELASCPPKAAAACGAETVKSGDKCEYSGAESVTITGKVADFQSERALGGAVVNFVDNDTGKPNGICGVAASNGSLTIKVPKDKRIGFVAYVEGAKDTYQFNVIYDKDQEDVFNSVSNITAQLIPGIIGKPIDETTGTAAGQILNKYGDTTTDTTEILVASASGKNAYYFNDEDLPVDQASQAKLNPKNGLFVMFDLKPGKNEITMKYAGTVSEVTDNTLFAFPDAIAISNVTCTLCEK